MTTQRTPKKDLQYRLTSIRNKLSTLRQEEDKINQKLSHEYAQSLCKYLMDAKATEIDFNVLLGGMLEVIELAKANSNRREAWQKSGLKFCRHRRQKQTSIAEGTTLQREGRNKPRAYRPNVGDGKNASSNEQ
jgi:hypothetical protein